jgi:hypothetical protein
MSEDRRIYVYMVKTHDLPKVTEIINSKRDLGLFTARVIDIRWPIFRNDQISFITVEMDGANQFDSSWKEYIVKEF